MPSNETEGLAERRTLRRTHQTETSAPLDVPATDEAEQLVRLWRRNPFRYFTQEEARTMFNIGETSFRKLASLPGCPLVARKVNPDHLKAWLWEMRNEIGKLTD